MPIQYLGAYTDTGAVVAFVRCDSIPLATGESLLVFVGIKHDGAARSVSSVQWDPTGVNQPLSKIFAYNSSNDLRTEYWGKVAPTVMTANLRVNLSDSTHAVVAWAVRVSGLLGLTPYHHGESEFSWVSDWPKTVTGINPTRFMFATQNHIRNSGTWIPDEMTEVSELGVTGTVNQKSLRAALMYKQCDDSDMAVGGNMSVERTGHLIRAAFVPKPTAGNQIIWMT